MRAPSYRRRALRKSASSCSRAVRAGSSGKTTSRATPSDQSMALSSVAPRGARAASATKSSAARALPSASRAPDQVRSYRLLAAVNLGHRLGKGPPQGLGSSTFGRLDDLLHDASTRKTERVCLHAGRQTCDVGLPFTSRGRRFPRIEGDRRRAPLDERSPCLAVAREPSFARPDRDDARSLDARPPVALRCGAVADHCFAQAGLARPVDHSRTYPTRHHQQDAFSRHAHLQKGNLSPAHAPQTHALNAPADEPVVHPLGRAIAWTGTSRAPP